MNILHALDWAAILKIVGIDIMLGVDNAIVIALACAALPAALRLRAILWGTLGAILLRATMLVFAGYLMNIPYAKLAAGAYLLYLGYKLLKENGEDDEPHVNASDRVLTAVKTIIVADFMMSLDNVLAVAAAAAGVTSHSTLYAIAGITVSIPVIVFGATALMGLMSRFPVIVWLGGGLLGWVGAEMLASEPFLSSFLAPATEVFGGYAHLAFPTAGFVSVVATALVDKYLQKRVNATPTATA